MLGLATSQRVRVSSPRHFRAFPHLPHAPQEHGYQIHAEGTRKEIYEAVRDQHKAEKEGAEDKPKTTGRHKVRRLGGQCGQHRLYSLGLALTQLESLR